MSIWEAHLCLCRRSLFLRVRRAATTGRPGSKKQIVALGRRGGARRMPERAAQMTPLEGARAALALTAAPRSMPCREQERAEITALCGGGRRCW